MGNILEKVKRFLQNKNTVTILCVLAGILLLYVIYNQRIQSAVKPVKIPYAKEVLASRHLITSDDISYIEVSTTVLNKMPNIIRNSSELLGYEVAYGDTIQQNGFFYKNDVTDTATNKQNASAVNNIEDNYYPIQIKVTLHSTFGNAIYPGNYIDLYYSGKDSNNRFMYGKFISSIKVIDVTDSNGSSVFETGSESRTPTQLIFAVDASTKVLLADAEKIGGTIIPVPRNKSYSANPGATKVSSSYLESYVKAQAAIIPDSSTSTSSTTTTDTEATDNVN